MVYLIGLFVLLMIAAPILAILPNAEQKAQMVKRKLAMAVNVRVELTHIDDPDPDPSKYLSNTGIPLERRLAVKAYRMALQRPVGWRERPARNWTLLRSSVSSSKPEKRTLVTGWQCERKPEDDFPSVLEEFLIRNLHQLPDDVILVEENNFILSIYWQERGEVKELLEFLSACASLPFEK